MKPIYLRELLPYIRGKVIWGEENRLIQQRVLKAPKYSLLKDHTLFFHSKRVLSLEKTKHFKNLVIITSNPNLLTKPGNNVTVVKVNNMKKAYWSFVEYYRGLLKLPFIAITGTCGKTTTKEMVA